MKHDIKNRTDIEKLITSFYSKVKVNKVLSYIFTDIAHVNFNRHLPIMFDFWENALFYTGNYTGDTMNVHIHLNKLFPLTKDHFDIWTFLFCETVDEHFEGPQADLAKIRANNIAKVMYLKIISTNEIKDE